LSVFPHDISKTEAARITKLDVEMFHDESWKSAYFGVKRLKVKVRSHKNISGVGLCTLDSVVFKLLIVITKHEPRAKVLLCSETLLYITLKYKIKTMQSHFGRRVFFCTNQH